MALRNARPDPVERGTTSAAAQAVLLPVSVRVAARLHYDLGHRRSDKVRGGEERVRQTERVVEVLDRPDLANGGAS